MLLDYRRKLLNRKVFTVVSLPKLWTFNQKTKQVNNVESLFAENLKGPAEKFDKSVLALLTNSKRTLSFCRDYEVLHIQSDTSDVL